jgi:hypothetical protein
LSHAAQPSNIPFLKKELWHLWDSPPCYWQPSWKSFWTAITLNIWDFNNALTH